MEFLATGLRPRSRAWIAAAAVAVFLLGGTLLTRGSLRTGSLSQHPGKPEIVSIQPTSYDLSKQEEQGQYTENGVLLFLEDTWLFVKAATPLSGFCGGRCCGDLYPHEKKE